jgi:hypothetical protein
MAEMLGTSTRAIQSYEQGWRTVPTAVHKLALLLLAGRQGRIGGAGAPCWEQADCADEAREQCPAFCADNGDLCWFLTGNRIRGAQLSSWQAKMDECMDCPVMAGVRADLES